MQEDRSRVEFELGSMRAVIEGNQDFVSDTLERLLVFSSKAPVAMPVVDPIHAAPDRPDAISPPLLNAGTRLDTAAAGIHVPPEVLKHYVTLDTDDVTPRVIDPRSLTLRDAIMLTGAVKQELTQNPVHDHGETKKRLEKDKVDTSRWKNVMFELRMEGMIKDTGSKGRYKDFTITPKAFKDLRDRFTSVQVSPPARAPKVTTLLEGPPLDVPPSGPRDEGDKNA